MIYFCLGLVSSFAPRRTNLTQVPGQNISILYPGKKTQHSSDRE